MVKMLVQCQERTEKAGGAYGILLTAAVPQQDAPEELKEAIKSFFKWTPSGRLEFGTVNEAAALMLTPGKYYEVLIREPEAGGGLGVAPTS